MLMEWSGYSHGIDFLKSKSKLIDTVPVLTGTVDGLGTQGC